MPRQISAALRTALLNPDPSKVKVFNMVHLDLETQPLYVHNDVGTVEWQGQSWTGLGDLGQVSEVVEDGVIAPGRFNLSLNGLKPEWLADARSERHMGSAGPTCTWPLCASADGAAASATQWCW